MLFYKKTHLKLISYLFNLYIKIYQGKVSVDIVNSMINIIEVDLGVRTWIQNYTCY